jgi:hypothetical protein
MPHGGQLWISKDDVDDASSMDWWVGVDWSGDLLDSAHHNVFLLLVAAGNGIASSTLSIETKVLGKGLEEHDVVGVLGEELERV